jgi:hypothetical protein
MAHRFRRSESDAEWDELSVRWRDFFTAFVESMEIEPAFGWICDDDDFKDNRTPFEQALGVWHDETLSLGFAQGYSWITVLQRDHVEQLGGVTALEESRAFFEVKVLPGGGALLWATEHLADYADPVVIRRVWETIAPLLPPGTPHTDPPVEVTLVDGQRVEVVGPDPKIVPADAVEFVASR